MIFSLCCCGQYSLRLEPSPELEALGALQAVPFDIVLRLENVITGMVSAEGKETVLRKVDPRLGRHR
jgi:hypothetical protein